MTYLGDFKEDGDLYHKFTTRAFASGVPTQLAGNPVLSVYADEGTGTIKTTAEAYFDLDVDFNAITGLNNVRIDLSGDALFATQTDFAVVITTGTVGGVSVVGETVFTFSIENRSMGKPVGATLSDDIAAIKAETVLIVADTDDLQGNQGAWLTATGFATPTNITAGTITTVSGNVDGTVAGVTPSVAGDAMNLAADAIKAVSYDESTAWPITASDAGATQIARTGADSDTLETLSDEIATRAPSGEYDVQLDANVSTRSSHSAADVWTSLVEGTLQAKQAIQAILAFSGTKVDGGGTTTITYRDKADTKDRLTFTVDANGNRSNVTYDFD